MPASSSDGNFASVLAKAGQMPELTEGLGRDLPDGFPSAMPPHHKVVDSTDPTGIEGLIKYDFTCKRDVFLVYRPYESCNRCATAFAQGTAQIPATGDYACPHTRVTAYESVLNRTLSGEFLFGAENEVVQKDGSIVISLKWFEKKLAPKKKKSALAHGPGQHEEPDL